MKLVHAAISEFALALARPLRTSRGELDERRGFILELRASGGGRGRGEASPAYWLGGERISDTRAALDRIVSAIAGHPDSNDLLAAVSGGSLSLTPAAACALDTATLELEAREAGVSAASILGGDAAATIPVCALVAGASPNASAAEAERAVGEGYLCLKIKVGGRPVDDDLRRVEAVRERAGAAPRIRLDANRAWTIEDAGRAMKRLGDFGIDFIEEPLTRPAPERLAELRASTPIAIAVDESVGALEDLAAIAERGAADVVVLKAARLGGLRPALRMARFAERAGIKVVVTDSIESAVGMNAAVHLAAALKPPRLAIGLGGARTIAERDLTIAGFVASPVLMPGQLGFETVAVGGERESVDA